MLCSWKGPVLSCTVGVRPASVGQRRHPHNFGRESLNFLAQVFGGWSECLGSNTQVAGVQNLARLAQSALAALEVTLGPLPLSAADVTPAIVDALTEDLRSATAVVNVAPPATPGGSSTAAFDADTVVAPMHGDEQLPGFSSAAASSGAAMHAGGKLDQHEEVASRMAGDDAGEGEEDDQGSMHDEHAYEATAARPSVRWKSDVEGADGLGMHEEGAGDEGADTTEVGGTLVGWDERGREALGSQRTEDWEKEALGIEDEVSHARCASASAQRSRGQTAGEKRLKYASSFEFVDAASAPPAAADRAGPEGTHWGGGGVGREALDQRLRRHREELRHVAAMAAAAAVAAGGQGAAGRGLYGVSFDAAMRALAAGGRAAVRRAKEDGLRGVAPGRKEPGGSGWVSGAARGAEAAGLEMVQGAPGCPSLPWKVVHPVRRSSGRFRHAPTLR